jgi:hypothetical protein
MNKEGKDERMQEGDDVEPLRDAEGFDWDDDFFRDNSRH